MSYAGARIGNRAGELALDVPRPPWSARSVEEAANGAEAVELAAELRPDVALVDVRMPVLDGLAAIEKLLGIGVGTVKTHVGSILEKTECESRVPAALLAHRAGLVS
ncbi:response regulator [Streptomyces sp. NPDC051080]|uniref:response regulator transcription factor n=2 Tax=Streptomyces TaxID=1883 RepID=UPI00342B21A0